MGQQSRRLGFFRLRSGPEGSIVAERTVLREAKPEIGRHSSDVSDVAPLHSASVELRRYTNRLVIIMHYIVRILTTLVSLFMVHIPEP